MEGKRQPHHTLGQRCRFIRPDGNSIAIFCYDFRTLKCVYLQIVIEFAFAKIAIHEISQNSMVSKAIIA